MAGHVELWLRDTDSDTWLPAVCDSSGKLKISDADPFTVAQDTPENLKHVPHGYYVAGATYLPLAVDENGVLQMAYAGSLALGDLSDVDVPSPTDQYVLTYDNASGLWIAQAPPVTAAAWATHIGNASAHHTKTIDASELSTGLLPTARLQTNITTVGLVFIIDGGGSAITTGEKGHLEIPFSCTITQVTMLADQTGSIVVDIWKDTYANFPPTDADSITASAPPTISATQKSQDSTLSGWTTAISAGDILAFNVDSCSTIERVTISLMVVKT